MDSKLRITTMQKRANGKIRETFSSAEMFELSRRVLLAIMNENLPIVDPTDRKVSEANQHFRVGIIEDRVNLARYRAGLKRFAR